MVNMNDVPILLEVEDGFKIVGATFPKREGWDYDGSFSGRSEGTGRRRLVFVLRERVIENGYAGKNYKRGVVWTGKGYVDITYFLDTGIWTTHDGIFGSGGYKTACSSMDYVEMWEQKDLERGR
jgi:hypothetical protein